MEPISTQRVILKNSKFKSVKSKLPFYALFINDVIVFLCVIEHEHRNDLYTVSM